MKTKRTISTILFILTIIVILIMGALLLISLDMRLCALSDTYTGYYNNIQLTADQLLHYSDLLGTGGLIMEFVMFLLMFTCL